MDEIKLTRLMDGLRANKDPYYRFWVGFIKAFKASKMSQEALSEATKISQPHVSRIIKGLTLPSAEKIAKLCDALGMDREDIEGCAGPEVEEQMRASLPAPYLAASGTKISSMLPPSAPPDPRARLVLLPYIRVWNLWPDDTGTGWQFGPESPIAFDKGWIYLMNASEKLGVYRAEDDSMSPALNPGDMAIIDTEYKTFASPGVYFALADGMPFFCRFARRDKARDLPDRISVDNDESGILKDELPTGEVVPFLELDEEHLFTVVGKVVMAVRTLI